MKLLRDRLSLYTQSILWLFGLSVHNKYRDECTPDFRCCCKDVDKGTFKNRWNTLVYFRNQNKLMNKYFREGGK